MKCIHCNREATSVANSRSTKQGRQVWRRRKCSACKRAFTTYESVNPNFIKVRNGDTTVRYERVKLFSSIYRALDKKTTNCYHITETIEDKLIAENSEILDSDKIIEIASETLRRYSKSAYLRYLSFYPEFATESDLN